MILNLKKNQIRCTEFSFILKPSTLGGVGVFATHDIPKGTSFFSGSPSPRRMNPKNIPADFIKYCIFISDEECLCPERFDRMNIGWYINHSSEPNIGKNSDSLISICDIQAGEEILLNYNELNEPEHLKEAYYSENK
ncbi:MAG: hypothetical protein K0R24_1400 [Gammaproteobacteria bacterium]|jgi:SET domain-containing protein|nr:hypothetical protein [Gammaproteobacteria bacterium]MCE3238419.1 hypothetical protein [Gammaproteobacteria bacterium]